MTKSLIRLAEDSEQAARSGPSRADIEVQRVMRPDGSGIAGRTLQSIDYSLGWLMQVFWNGPVRGLCCERRQFIRDGLMHYCRVGVEFHGQLHHGEAVRRR
jgi:hypothetical protein